MKVLSLLSGAAQWTVLNPQVTLPAIAGVSAIAYSYHLNHRLTDLESLHGKVVYDLSGIKRGAEQLLTLRGSGLSSQGEAALRTLQENPNNQNALETLRSSTPVGALSTNVQSLWNAIKPQTPPLNLDQIAIPLKGYGKIKNWGKKKNCLFKKEAQQIAKSLAGKWNSLEGSAKRGTISMLKQQIAAPREYRLRRERTLFDALYNQGANLITNWQNLLNNFNKTSSSSHQQPVDRLSNENVEAIYALARDWPSLDEGKRTQRLVALRSQLPQLAILGDELEQDFVRIISQSNSQSSSSSGPSIDLRECERALIGFTRGERFSNEAIAKIRFLKGNPKQASLALQKVIDNLPHYAYATERNLAMALHPPVRQVIPDNLQQLVNAAALDLGKVNLTQTTWQQIEAIANWESAEKNAIASLLQALPKTGHQAMVSLRALLSPTAITFNRKEETKMIRLWLIAGLALMVGSWMCYDRTLATTSS